jgi:hypothetical protein
MLMSAMQHAPPHALPHAAAPAAAAAAAASARGGSSDAAAAAASAGAAPRTAEDEAAAGAAEAASAAGAAAACCGGGDACGAACDLQGRPCRREHGNEWKREAGMWLVSTRLLRFMQRVRCRGCLVRTLYMLHSARVLQAAQR